MSLKPAADILAAITKRQENSAEDLATLWDAPITPADIGYIHTVLCQVGLPRSRQKGMEYEHRYGRAHILVTAGKLYEGERRGFVQQCVPFGPYARLLMHILTTEAIKKQSPIVTLGESARHFIADRLKKDSGGKTYEAVYRQLTALVACTIKFGGQYPDGRKINTQGSPFLAFEDNDSREGQLRLWPSHITFSADHFNGLLQHAAVPLNQKAVIWLSENGGALAIDLYWWLAQKLCLVRHGMTIEWQPLYQQFGAGYDDIRDFRKELKRALPKVLEAYPDARFELERAGLTLYPSKPPVPRTLVSGR